MLKIIIELFVFYFIYKLIFEFIIPVYKATKQMKRKMNEFQDQMNQNNQFETHQPNKTTQQETKQDSSEYIEYEEIK
jgi:Sec-independent protein translocase protein TatA